MRKILHSAIDKVFNWHNLSAASKKVMRNKGSAGVDRMSVDQWKSKKVKHLRDLRRQLMNDTYRSKPVLRRYIDKPGSKKKRPLGIPAVKDRVCQQAVLNVLGPVFEEYFHPNSHGFRPGRSTETAARQVEELRRQGYRHVVDLDIKGFFDQVDHEILMKLVRRVVKDRRVLGLIRGWLKAGVMEEGKVRYETSGTPQGGVISPLLSNIYLTVLDYGLDRAGYRFVRYADDIVILCRTRRQAENALEKVRELLGRLKLQVNEEKTQITSFKEQFDFLGFCFKSRYRGIAEKSLKSFYAKVRDITRRHQGDKPVAKVIENLNPVLRGWGNYHRNGSNVGMFKRLDKWVRKRLRSYVNKRWGQYTKSYCPKPTTEELAEIGLFFMIDILRPDKSHLMLN